MVRAIVCHFFTSLGPSIEQQWNAMKGEGIVITTDYSGIGTSEFAIALIMEALIHYGHLATTEAEQFAIFWRSCDILRSCRKVMKDMPAAHKPRHIAGDLLTRLSSDVLHRLRVALKAALRDFTKGTTRLKKEIARVARQRQQRAARKQAGGSRRALVKKRPASTSASSRADLVRDHGRAFLKTGWAEVCKEPPAAQGHCYVCMKRCDLHPSATDRANRRYINLSGNTCIPWSTMGQKMGWLHEATISMLSWLWSLVSAKVDIIVNECTPRFDITAVAELVSDSYIMKTCVFGPDSLGIPVRRTRRYSIFIRKDQLTFHVDYTSEVLAANFFRACVLDARVFFRAPDSFTSMVFNKMAEARGMPDGTPIDMLIAVGARHRKAEYTRKAIAAGLDFICMNISQHSDYYANGALSTDLPTLTTGSSQIWGKSLMRGAAATGIDRALLGYEKLAAHGWPVLLPAAHPLSRLLPSCFSFRSVLSPKSPLTESDFSSFTGNGMHIAQIGLVAAFAILAVGVPPDSRS